MEQDPPSPYSINSHDLILHMQGPYHYCRTMSRSLNLLTDTCYRSARVSFFRFCRFVSRSHPEQHTIRHIRFASLHFFASFYILSMHFFRAAKFMVDNLRNKGKKGKIRPFFIKMDRSSTSFSKITEHLSYFFHIG